MPIIDKLERQENLTEAERELALFILANTGEVTRMSIAELAEQSFTSNATVIRLCRKLGLKGYRDFRIELTQVMATEETTRCSFRDPVTACED